MILHLTNQNKVGMTKNYYAASQRKSLIEKKKNQEGYTNKYMQKKIFISDKVLFLVSI